MDYDFIIVGSGSVGAAAGYYASRAGLKVLMIDRGHPPHDAGSHHGETRLIRHAYGEGASYVPMVLQAQALWDALQTESDEEVFVQSGVIYFGTENSDFLKEVRHSAEKWNIELEVLDAQVAMQRWPQVTLPNDFVVMHEPAAGFLRCETALRTYVRLALQNGADQAFGTLVQSITSNEDGITVSDGKMQWQAPKVLVSAGTWVKELLPHLPLTPVRKVFIWHDTDGQYERKDGFPSFASVFPDGRMFYGFPADENGLKVAQHTGGQEISSPEERLPFGAYESDMNEVSDFLQSCFPGVGTIRHGESCTYDNSPDEDFIIDTLPEQSNVMLITGLSGHGFKFASVLGEIASDFAQQQASEFDLTPFRLSRFQKP